MKKRFILVGIFLVIVLSLALFAGCGNTNGDEEPEPEPQALSVTDYFPIKENVKYVYEGEGNEYASFEVYIDYTSEDKVQQRVNNGGTVVARVFTIKDGALTRVLSRGEAYYRENLLDAKEGEEEVLLMEPLEAGTTWTLEDGRTRTITSVDAEVSTPLATYTAIEVVTEGVNDKSTDYFAKDIGLVKTIFESEGAIVSSSIKEFCQGSMREEIIEFYFPNIDDGKLYFKNKLTAFKTNEDITKILSDAYKEAIVSNVGPVFTSNVEIKSISLNKDSYVELDLNSAFQTEMNAGSGYEAMILQSLANTFAQYYNAKGVVLTIEGQPYASGHIEMEKGQPILVDYSNSVEIDV